MRKLSVLAAALAVVALTATAALAEATTSITFSPTGEQTVDAFPHTRSVSATFFNEPAGGDNDGKGLCQNNNGTAWTFWVEDESGATLAATGGTYLLTEAPKVCPYGTTQTEWLHDVEFPEPGTYALKATLATLQGRDIAAAEEDALELIQELEEEIVVSAPAAPAVAAKYLADHGINARYGSGKTGGNFVSDVARRMGPGTDFDGVSKENMNAYREAIVDFLERHSRW